LKRLKALLVGFGKVGVGYADDPLMARYFPYATHAQVLARHPRFSWIGVVDPSEKALDPAREIWKVPVCVRDVEDLPRDLSPDVVVLAIPPKERLRIMEQLPTVRAAIVEKPLAINVDEGQSFCDWCRARNILLQVNYWRRADKQMRQLSQGELLKRVGDVQAVFGLYGNGLLNNGSHMIDLARMLFGEVTSVSAGRVRSGFSIALDDDLNLPFQLEMESGLMVMMQPLNFREYRENSLDIWGTTGRLAVYQEGLALLHYPRVPNRSSTGDDEIASDHPKRLRSTVGMAFFEMYSNLAAAVSGKEPLCSTGESALATAKVVEAVRYSAQTGMTRVAL
jgi:predicted dehydrogenase